MKLTVLSKPSGEIYSAMYGEYDPQPNSLVIDFDKNIELLFNEYMIIEASLYILGHDLVISLSRYSYAWVGRCADSR